MANSSEPDTLTTAQVAALLNITRRAVIHRIHRGQLTAIKTGPKTSTYLITRAEVERVVTAAREARALSRAS